MGIGKTIIKYGLENYWIQTITVIINQIYSQKAKLIYIWNLLRKLLSKEWIDKTLDILDLDIKWFLFFLFHAWQNYEIYIIVKTF